MLKTILDYNKRILRSGNTIKTFFSHVSPTLVTPFSNDAARSQQPLVTSYDEADAVISDLVKDSDIVFRGMGREEYKYIHKTNIFGGYNPKKPGVSSNLISHYIDNNSNMYTSYTLDSDRALTYANMNTPDRIIMAINFPKLYIDSSIFVPLTAEELGFYNRRPDTPIIPGDANYKTVSGNTEITGINHCPGNSCPKKTRPDILQPTLNRDVFLFAIYSEQGNVSIHINKNYRPSPITMHVFPILFALKAEQVDEKARNLKIIDADSRFLHWEDTPILVKIISTIQEKVNDDDYSSVNISAVPRDIEYGSPALAEYILEEFQAKSAKKAEQNLTL